MGRMQTAIYERNFYCYLQEIVPSYFEYLYILQYFIACAQSGTDYIATIPTNFLWSERSIGQPALIA